MKILLIIILQSAYGETISRIETFEEYGECINRQEYLLHRQSDENIIHANCIKGTII